MTPMKPYLYGLVAALGLLAIYGVTMTALSGWEATVEQFRALWYFMIPLATGFGVQVGLYTKLKAAMKEKANACIIYKSHAAAFEL